MSVHPLISSAADPVRQAKVHLAAALRLAVLHELEEGIDNHFTVTVPGHEERHLILPFGLHWSEARASDMIVFDESGSDARRQRRGRALGAVHSRADPSHLRIARGHAHPPDLGGRAQHAEGQPARPGEPDGGVLPRPRRLRRQLHGHRATSSRRASAWRARDGRQARRLHEEPRRARHGRDGRTGVPPAVQAGAHMPRAGAGDVAPASRSRCSPTRSWRSVQAPAATTAIPAPSASACSSRR